MHLPILIRGPFHFPSRPQICSGEVGGGGGVGYLTYGIIAPGNGLLSIDTKPLPEQM